MADALVDCTVNCLALWCLPVAFNICAGFCTDLGSIRHDCVRVCCTCGNRDPPDEQEDAEVGATEDERTPLVSERTEPAQKPAMQASH